MNLARFDQNHGSASYRAYPIYPNMKMKYFLQVWFKIMRECNGFARYISVLELAALYMYVFVLIGNVTKTHNLEVAMASSFHCATSSPSNGVHMIQLHCRIINCTFSRGPII